LTLVACAQRVAAHQLPQDLLQTYPDTFSSFLHCAKASQTFRLAPKGEEWRWREMCLVDHGGSDILTLLKYRNMYSKNCTNFFELMVNYLN